MKILIIGGSSSLGISLAKYLSELGNEVTITYYKHECKLDNIKACYLDIRDEESIDKLIKDNHYDTLINMAAVSYDNLFFDTKKEDFIDLLNINLVGTYSASKIFSKYNPKGIIVNVASTDGIDTYNEYNMLYAASKAGVINLSKSMALSTDNKVLCICPNWIDSDSTREMDKTYLESELKRIGQDRLITMDEFNQSVYKIIMEYHSGDVIRIDIKGDKLWIAKVS